MANGLFAGGDGTELNPYLIEDAHDLNAVRNGLDKHYKLINDIDLNISPYNEGEGWIPIGRGNSNSPATSFRGVLDGDKRRVFGLYINRGTALYNGLFGTTNKAYVKNLSIQNSYVVSARDSGLLIGYTHDSTVENCYTLNCEIDGGSADRIGGLLGYLSSSQILNCHSDTEVYGTHAHRGGLVGSMINSTCKNCFSIGFVQVGGGGLIGYRYGNNPVTNSFFDTQSSATSITDGGIGLLTTQMKTAQTFIDAGWHTALNDDGSPVWILKDGEYPRLWSSRIKHLIKSQNKIHTLLEDEWTDITENIVDINNISQEEYESYGMSSLAGLPMDILNQEDEFEVLTWSDNGEVVEKTVQGTEHVIDEGKLFVATLEDFMKITNVEIV